MLNSRLCQEYLLAKKLEAEAKATRLAIEEKIVEQFAPLRPEGTESKVVDGFKISVTSKLKRSLDVKAYEAMNLNESMRFVDFKPSINLKNLRAVEKVFPQVVAKGITTKPGKPSLKIEAIQEKEDAA